MRPWVYTAVCLVAFTAIMSALGWVVHASVPGAHAWLIEHIGRAGLWVFFVVVFVAGAVAAYRGRKPKGT